MLNVSICSFFRLNVLVNNGDAMLRTRLMRCFEAHSHLIILHGLRVSCTIHCLNSARFTVSLFGHKHCIEVLFPIADHLSKLAIKATADVFHQSKRDGSSCGRKRDGDAVKAFKHMEHLPPRKVAELTQTVRVEASMGVVISQ